MGRDRLWIIDPIDGTRAFMEGREEWCVAAALAVQGRPVLAAVYSPAPRRILPGRQRAAAPRSTARRSRSPIPPRSKAPTSPATARRWPASPISASPPTRSGSLPLQLRLAHVAAGRLDGAVSIGKRNDWDLAAGELLVIEAGGRVSGVSGEGYIYNRPQPWQQGLVAAGAKRHAALIDALGDERPRGPEDR